MTQGSAVAAPSNRTAIGLWCLIGLLALTFVTTGASKIASVPPSPENFARWGFSTGFMYAIGAAEVLGGIALLLPRIAALTAIALIGVMLGALETGLVHGEALHIALPFVLVGLLAIVAYGRRAPLLRLLGRAER